MYQAPSTTPDTDSTATNCSDQRHTPVVSAKPRWNMPNRIMNSPGNPLSPGSPILDMVNTSMKNDSQGRRRASPPS